MYTSFENKLDNFFEQFEVPREPIRSGMQAAVTQKIKGIWDEGKFSKYNRVTNDEAEKILTDKKKLVDSLNKTIVDVSKIKNPQDTTKPEPGVSKKAKATANYICSNTGCKDAKIIKTILLQMLTAINTNESPKQQKITLTELGKKYKLSEIQINGILKLLYDPETEFTALEPSSEIIAKMAGVEDATKIAGEQPAKG